MTLAREGACDQWTKQKAKDNPGFKSIQWPSWQLK